MAHVQTYENKHERQSPLTASKVFLDGDRRNCPPGLVITTDKELTAYLNCKVNYTKRPSPRWSRAVTLVHRETGKETVNRTMFDADLFVGAPKGSLSRMLNSGASIEQNIYYRYYIVTIGEAKI